MLVLSRKVGQEIRLLEAGVTIRVTSSGSNKVQLSIDAPRELTVLRGELDADHQETAKARTAKAALDRLANWADTVDAGSLVENEALVDELIERLIALRLAARQSRAKEKGAGLSLSDTAVPSGSRPAALSVHQPKADYRVESKPETPNRMSSRFYAGGSCAGPIANTCECV